MPNELCLCPCKKKKKRRTSSSKSVRVVLQTGRTQRRKKSGYIKFYTALIRQNPGLTVPQASKIAGQAWRKMSDRQKSRFN